MPIDEYKEMTESEQAGEDFMTKNWRPMMAMTYMLTCMFDFIIGPILYNILQFYNPGQHLDMWQPLTLQGGGLYHIAMGVVLGITAHGRTQEKINSGTQQALPSLTSFIPAQPIQQSIVHPTQPVIQQLNTISEPTPQSYPMDITENKFGKVVPVQEFPIL